MLNRFTIRFRIIAAIAFMLVTMMCLGAFSANRLSEVNAAANDVATNWLPSSQNIGQISAHFERYRLLEGVALLQSGPERAAKLEKAQGVRAQLADDFKTYQPLISKGRETELASTMKAALDDYFVLADEFHTKLDGSQDPAATAIFVNEMQPKVDAARQAIQADLDFQVSEGQKAASQGVALGKFAIILIYIALGTGTCVGLSIGWMMITGISSPVRRMAETMRQLAKGNTGLKIPNLGETNEIGEMAAAVEVFKDGMIRNAALENEAIHAREQTEVERKTTMRTLADQFESAVGGIVDMVSSAATEMQATASQLTASAKEASTQATTVSAAAEEAGTNVTSVAGSAEELGASVSEIGRQVEHSLHKAREGVAEADSTAAIVYELSEAASRINGIVEMISGIASQTNLLALNATIESARAGEAGRGFAVVASEVKQLAGQTSKATADISAQIAAIQATTKRAVEAIENISGTIRDINESSTTIAAAVEQQGSATNEIVQAVNQASVGTSEVTSSISGVARMAEETGAGAGQVLSASSELAQQAEQLRTQVGAFIAQIRTA